MSTENNQTPTPEEPQPNIHTEKKKDIKFLILYTTVFVVVICGLLAGSYMMTQRIQGELAQNDHVLNTNQSTLKNIQNENASLKNENIKLKDENAKLTASEGEAMELLTAVNDMVEHDQLLIAVQAAYINGNQAQAKELFAAIDPQKLSAPSAEAYNTLKAKLGIA